MAASSKGTWVGETALDAAYHFVRRGYAPVPIPRGEKGPRISRWPSFRPTEDELPKYFRQDQNVGLILGTASGGLLDVDLDSPEAIAVADSLLPPTELAPHPGCFLARDCAGVRRRHRNGS